MNATILPPPPTPPKGLRLWVFHPRNDVEPKLVPVRRVLKGRSIVVILEEKSGKEYGVPVAWLNVPADAESVCT